MRQRRLLDKNSEQCRGKCSNRGHGALGEHKIGLAGHRLALHDMARDVVCVAAEFAADALQLRKQGLSLLAARCNNAVLQGAEEAQCGHFRVIVDKEPQVHGAVALVRCDTHVAQHLGGLACAILLWMAHIFHAAARLPLRCRAQQRQGIAVLCARSVWARGWRRCWRPAAAPCVHGNPFLLVGVWGAQKVVVVGVHEPELPVQVSVSCVEHAVGDLAWHIIADLRLASGLQTVEMLGVVSSVFAGQVAPVFRRTVVDQAVGARVDAGHCDAVVPCCRELAQRGEIDCALAVELAVEKLANIHAAVVREKVLSLALHSAIHECAFVPRARVLHFCCLYTM
eukprot:comp16633_c0_seq1/m.26854 comp16633_c0_seq1/g.26854  ORF comp16633_c0_seq1/g.26854 comp16633_c0_seq1/m.26854 type:complete len:340 (-) comp16633_c0_seq1:124-1143(-)